MAASTLPLCGVPGTGRSKVMLGVWAGSWDTAPAARSWVRKSRLCITVFYATASTLCSACQLSYRLHYQVRLVQVNPVAAVPGYDVAEICAHALRGRRPGGRQH